MPIDILLGLASSVALAGYLFYDYTHYYVHHFVPRSQLGKQLREQHMRHHFQDHRYGFGVSSPLWDAIMGTLPRGRKTASPSDRGHERPPRTSRAG